MSRLVLKILNMIFVIATTRAGSSSDQQMSIFSIKNTSRVVGSDGWQSQRNLVFGVVLIRDLKDNKLLKNPRSFEFKCSKFNQFSTIKIATLQHQNSFLKLLFFVFFLVSESRHTYRKTKKKIIMLFLYFSFLLNSVEKFTHNEQKKKNKKLINHNFGSAASQMYRKDLRMKPLSTRNIFPINTNKH